MIGRTLSHYKITAKLGEGGMGEVYRAEGVHFLTMQRVDGEPLSELIPAEGLPAERILEITKPLTEALAKAGLGGPSAS